MIKGVRHFISSMTLTDAGHGDVLGLQRKGNALLLWISWSHYSGGTRKTDLVRFQWKAGYLYLVVVAAGVQDHAEVRHYAECASQARAPRGLTSSIASAATAEIVTSVAKSMRLKAA